MGQGRIRADVRHKGEAQNPVGLQRLIRPEPGHRIGDLTCRPDGVRAIHHPDKVPGRRHRVGDAQVAGDALAQWVKDLNRIGDVTIGFSEGAYGCSTLTV